MRLEAGPGGPAIILPRPARDFAVPALGLSGRDLDPPDRRIRMGRIERPAVAGAGGSRFGRPYPALIFLLAWATVMKTAQWVAVLFVSAGIVFGLTFAVNYLGRGGSDKGKRKVAATAPQAQLTWADNVTNYPEDLAWPAACEDGYGDSHDFWFKNENAQALPVGVLSRSCHCVTVRIWTSSDWKDFPEAANRAKAVKELEAKAGPTELSDRQLGRGACGRGWRGTAGMEMSQGSDHGTLDGRERRRPRPSLRGQHEVQPAVAGRVPGNRRRRPAPGQTSL